ncbi:organic hydroperoxide resistance protein [Thalassotalea insulae]|nr:organic hydroperoxide resistance protein [Thalassotalea insulae]
MNRIYQAQVTSTGGREGRSVSTDNRLNLALSTPKELGGNDGAGTNPEQLFAAGYSACFIGAIKFVAGQQKLALPNDLSVTATVGIGENPKGAGFAIAVDLNVSLPGLTQQVAEQLIDTAHQVCPYSNATRGNIDITTNIDVAAK